MKPPFGSARPYHFPSLAQVRGSRASLGGAALDAAQLDWDSALAEGYRQGQRDGYEAGLDEGRADGAAQGYEEGLARGIAEAQVRSLERMGEIGKPLDAALKALKKLEAEYRAAQRTEVVDLVGKIARQVIRAELALQPVQLLALVDEALAAMPPTRDKVEVCLNPEEFKRVMELDPKRAKKWNLMGDPALAMGECRVKAGDLEVDAGCQNRLAACMEQVREQLDLQHDPSASGEPA